MITVKIQGGLGNQLFQYAFAFSLAKEIKTKYFLDFSYPFIVPIYFQVNRIHLWLNNNKYLSKINRRICKNIKSRQYFDYTDCSLSPKLTLKINNAYYEGYFQSKDFFLTSEYLIRKRFSVRKKYQRKFIKKYKGILENNKILVIHIRRTDYKIQGIGKSLSCNDLSLPLDYYKKSLALIKDLDKYKIFAVGDDTEFAKENFSYLNNISFPNNEMIIDFLLIMNSDVAIISNSTFAWWASLLNNKKDKRVIAPKYFLGFYANKEFPNGIYNDTSFETIDVFE